jgi:hypothetical protein
MRGDPRPIGRGNRELNGPLRVMFRRTRLFIGSQIRLLAELLYCSPPGCD